MSKTKVLIETEEERAYRLRVIPGETKEIRKKRIVREYVRKYHRSEFGSTKVNLYRASDRGKEVQKRATSKYRKSEKGRIKVNELNRNYAKRRRLEGAERSESRRESKRKWRLRNPDAFRKWLIKNPRKRKQYNKRYKKSDKGKIANQRYNKSEKGRQMHYKNRILRQFRRIEFQIARLASELNIKPKKRKS